MGSRLRFLGLIAALGAGLFALFWVLREPATPGAGGVSAPVHDHSQGPGHAQAPDAIHHWTCPMHPSVKSKDPGKCPICSMELVPVLNREMQSGEVILDAHRRQQIGVRTAAVGRADVVVSVRAMGALVQDETRLTDVSLKYAGWIGKVFADYRGFTVEKGAPLFSVYSPELLSAQEELLESERRAQAGSSRTLVETSRRRLRLWGMSERQIVELVKEGRASEFVPMLSPVSGTVIEKNVVDGSGVAAGQLLYRIADLSTLWVEAAVYEGDLPLVRVGQRAEVTLTYLPGEVYAATVTWVPPVLQATSRTARVRLELPNPDAALKPEMYASVEISIPLGEQLVVPVEAVVMAGRKHVVFVDLGEGRLQPRRLVLGRRTPQGFIVREGLAEGEVVVTSGNFLIASESRLKAGVDAW
jgi:Cu(I)/Ag(I) efflux system membrane fusion protein